MKYKSIEAVINGVAPAIREFLERSVSSIELRLKAVEERALVPGAPGERGEQGAAGEPGPSGEPGEPGTAGPAGERGPPGENGVPGEKGDRGDKGDTGEAGASGEKGDAGEPGGPGENGVPGEKGLDGKDGALGNEGPGGKRGEKGMDGKDGRDGREGKDGKDGITVEQLEAATLKALAAALGEIRLEGRKLMLGDRLIKTLAIPLYRKVYQPDTDYEPGDFATFGGDVWHCNTPTRDKPGTSDAWTLAIKKGRDFRPLDREPRPPQGSVKR